MPLTRRAMLKATVAAVPAYFAGRARLSLHPRLMGRQAALHRAVASAAAPSQLAMDQLCTATDVPCSQAARFLTVSNCTAEKPWPRTNRTNCYSTTEHSPDCPRPRESGAAIPAGIAVSCVAT